jgi:hypothetical protein
MDGLSEQEATMGLNRGNLIYDPNRLVLTIEDRALLWSARASRALMRGPSEITEES